MFKPVLFKLWKFKPVQTTQCSNQFKAKVQTINYIDQTTDYYMYYFELKFKLYWYCYSLASLLSRVVLQHALAVVPPVPRPVSPSCIVAQHGASLSYRGAVRDAWPL